MSVTPRKSVTTRLMVVVSCSAVAPRITPSLSPAMNVVGWLIFRSVSSGVDLPVAMEVAVEVDAAAEP